AIVCFGLGHWTAHSGLDGHHRRNGESGSGTGLDVPAWHGSGWRRAADPQETGGVTPSLSPQNPRSAATAALRFFYEGYKRYGLPVTPLHEPLRLASHGGGCSSMMTTVYTGLSTL